MDVLPTNYSGPLDEARVAETYLYDVRAQSSSDRCDGVGLYVAPSSEHSNKPTNLIHGHFTVSRSVSIVCEDDGCSGNCQ